MLRCFGGSVVLVAIAFLLLACPVSGAGSSHSETNDTIEFPQNLDSYGDDKADGLWAILKNRVQQTPFNLVATTIFFLAILHTFMTSRFLAIAHRWEHHHQEQVKTGQADRHSVHIGAELFHFLGEIEVVFGLWASALTGAIFHRHRHLHRPDHRAAARILDHRACSHDHQCASAGTQIL